MINTESNRSLLGELAQEYGIVLDQRQSELLLMHLDLLVEENKRINLTRITEAREAIVRHVIDSLLFAKSMDGLSEAGSHSFVDIGTGGGFPGIPVAIATGMRGTLVDSVAKKTRSVDGFIESLGLRELLEVKAVRAEDLARTNAADYDFVLARAVAELNVLVEYASPLLHKGGHLIASKAHIADEEVLASTETARMVGMDLVSRETFELPDSSGHREMMVFVKKGAGRIKLPRANGMAKHKPLVPYKA